MHWQTIWYASNGFLNSHKSVKKLILVSQGNFYTHHPITYYNGNFKTNCMRTKIKKKKKQLSEWKTKKETEKNRYVRSIQIRYDATPYTNPFIIFIIFGLWEIAFNIQISAMRVSALNIPFYCCSVQTSYTIELMVAVAWNSQILARSNTISRRTKCSTIYMFCTLN